MRAVYYFPVEGQIKPSQNLLIQLEHWTLTWRIENDLVTHLIVEVELQSQDDWPIIEDSSDPNIAQIIDPKAPHLPFIQMQLQTLQGALSLFGLKRIDWERFEIEWFPDNDEEKENLKLFSYKREPRSLEPHEIRQLPVDIIARAALSEPDLYGIKTILNFFRRGRASFFEKEYISSIYQFYFIIESLYADGKFRRKGTVKSMLESKEFMQCLLTTTDWESSFAYEPLADINSVKARYGSLGPKELVEKIFDTRGFLHHHSPKRRDIWNPENQERFKVDAMFFEALAFNICTSLAFKHMYSSETESKYLDAIESHNARVKSGNINF